MQSKLEELDLNLLKLLRIVVETRNTSQAAEVLGISQTSVSRGMAKLRETFGDQLFIRKAHGVEPSELAEKLAEAAENMLKPFSEVLEAYQTFDPSEYKGSVSIAVELGLLEIFGPGLYRALNRALPNAQIRVVYWKEESLHHMFNRQLDYMIHYTLMPFPQDIYVHHLSEIAISLVARKDHPVLSKSTNWEDIHHLPLVKLVAEAMKAKHDPYDEMYLSKGYEPKVCLVTHSVPIAVEKLLSSDAIKFSSSYLLSHNDQLECYPLPKISKDMRKISVSGCYLQSKRGQPINQFLHQTLETFFNSIEQPSF
ncbi:LysR family transcriptional regulator [Vibrio mediterranei]|uniref:Transcriptional regulator n=1 Tax=Vibrio mediterranei TaxID=689 RepID=A0ABX5DHS7_9VIBR|nr:LysR family transcriptional regulator [Vibrio mediterranei]PCD89895.1 transcriptional regulator [Vibrio mediterranei]PRQ69283.1 transcriptional regulator [Vibrio mediterranei]